MEILSNILHDVLPLLSALLLIIGLKAERKSYLIAALWLSLIALLLHYETAGGEILGSYFGYRNAAIYSVNLIVLITSLIILLYHLPQFHKKASRPFAGFISAAIIVGALLLLANLWINASFLENRRPDTIIMQVTTFKPLNYCKYRYVFYRINRNGKIGFLCPNHFGILPSIGQLEVAPNFILSHLLDRQTLKKNTVQQTQ